MSLKVNSGVFDTLSTIKCDIKTKGRFKYISWAEAWSELKKNYPKAEFKVYETESGYPAFIKKDIGGFVKVGVTINNLEHIEHYPIINFMNKAIKPDVMTVMDINNAIKRGLAKACALHGLGLWIYRGEELPEE